MKETLYGYIEETRSYSLDEIKKIMKDRQANKILFENSKVKIEKVGDYGTIISIEDGSIAKTCREELWIL